MSAPPTSLAESIERVQRGIADAAARAGRRPDEIKLIAVSKTRSAAEVAAAAKLGLRYFGENRVQEAATKIPLVRDLVDQPIEWHLVGSLQRNKVNQAVDLFAILQSVDSWRLAEAIARRTEGRIHVLLEVYLGDGQRRPGFRPAELREEIGQLAQLPRLDVRGLMTVAPLGLDERGVQSIFSRLRQLRDELKRGRPELSLAELSMGMTDDYPLAIAEGATIVRIGRAIFGERPFQ